MLQAWYVQDISLCPFPVDSLMNSETNSEFHHPLNWRVELFKEKGKKFWWSITSQYRILPYHQNFVPCFSLQDDDNLVSLSLFSRIFHNVASVERTRDVLNITNTSIKNRKCQPCALIAYVPVHYLVSALQNRMKLINYWQYTTTSACFAMCRSWRQVMRRSEKEGDVVDGYLRAVVISTRGPKDYWAAAFMWCVR